MYGLKVIFNGSQVGGILKVSGLVFIEVDTIQAIGNKTIIVIEIRIIYITMRFEKLIFARLIPP